MDRMESIPFKKRILLFCLIFIFFPVTELFSQNCNDLTKTETQETVRPQWVKDLRRWEIIAFGSFPFTMFFSTFGMDTYRFAKNGWNFDYAPWPLKNAGGPQMENKEFQTTIIIAASLSVAVAFADMAIVQAKRNKVRQQAASLPAGSTIITRSPWPPTAECDDIEQDKSGADTESNETDTGKNDQKSESVSGDVLQKSP